MRVRRIAVAAARVWQRRRRPSVADTVTLAAVAAAVSTAVAGLLTIAACEAVFGPTSYTLWAKRHNARARAWWEGVQAEATDDEPDDTERG